MTLNPIVLAKRVLRRLLSERQLGMIDYIGSPERATAFGPFNGQPARKALFDQILAKTAPQAIVETVSYLGMTLGMTTELLVQTGLPIYTVEAHPRFYGFVRARFWRNKNIKAFQGDSRAHAQDLVLLQLLRPAADSIWADSKGPFHQQESPTDRFKKGNDGVGRVVVMEVRHDRV